MQISPDVLEKTLGGKMVLLHLETGEYHTLNESGAVVWQGLRLGHPRQQIVEELARQFDAPAEVLAADVDTCLQGLLQRRLITSESR